MPMDIASALDVNTAQALLLALRSQLGDAGIQALLGMGSQAAGTILEPSKPAPPSNHDGNKQGDGTPEDTV